MTGRSACDFAVIGGGPAGMAAATEAVRLGLDTLLIDEQPEPGGQIYRAIETVARARPGELAMLGEEYAAGAALAAAFRASGAGYEPGGIVWQVRDDGQVGVSQGGASRLVAARRVLVATGAMERPVPIPGWTIPGVMGAGAAQALLKASGLVPAGPAVLVGTGPLLYLIAAQLVRAGATIAGLLLTAPEPGIGAAMKALRGGRALFKGLAWIRELRAAGVPMLYGVSRPAIEGEGRAAAVSFTQDGRRQRIAASVVLLHNGVVPAAALGLAAGCRQSWDAAQHCWRPECDAWGATSRERIAVAGDGAGVLGATAAACRGRLAALDAAMRLGKIDAARRDRMARRDRAELARQEALRGVLDRLFAPAAELLAPAGGDDIVCRCEEITAAELNDAVAAGNDDLNRVKAFTRCGMGPCQGRLCGPVAAEVVARALGRPVAEIGQLRVRLPVRPLPLAELAELT